VWPENSKRRRRSLKKKNPKEEGRQLIQRRNEPRTSSVEDRGTGAHVRSTARHASYARGDGKGKGRGGNGLRKSSREERDDGRMSTLGVPEGGVVKGTKGTRINQTPNKRGLDSGKRGDLQRRGRPQQKGKERDGTEVFASGTSKVSTCRRRKERNHLKQEKPGVFKWQIQKGGRTSRKERYFQNWRGGKGSCFSSPRGGQVEIKGKSSGLSQRTTPKTPQKAQRG